MRWLAGLSGVSLAIASLTTPAAIVTLDDGTQRKGQVIVREGIVTINVPAEEGRPRLFQYPASRVVRIQGDAQNPNIIARRTALRVGGSRSSEPLCELEKGQEVKRYAVQRAWVNVEAWNPEVRGFVLESDLAPEVEFPPEERASIKRRLGVTDPPPPPAAQPPVRSERPSAQPKGETAKPVIEESTAEAPMMDESLKE